MKIGILVQEGLKNYSDTPKSTQGAHLYTSYEATYALKWSGVEIFDKNQFMVTHTRYIRLHFCILVQEGPSDYSDTPK